jgi:hypothetical protein
MSRVLNVRLITFKTIPFAITAEYILWPNGSMNHSIHNALKHFTLALQVRPYEL